MAEKNEDRDNDQSDHYDLAKNWSCSTEFCPSAARICEIALYGIESELEVEQAANSDGVAEDLETRDHSSPDDDGGNDEKNVLEYTAKREDEPGGLADLDK